MVPMPILEHFLEDIADGSYDGFPSLGVMLQDMENPDLKQKYLVPEERTGMLVSKVLVGSPADGQIEVGDVILSVDGHPVADDGTVEFRPRQRTRISYFVQLHQVGEPMEVEILRDGAVQELTLDLHRPMQEDRLVPMEAYDVRPRYFVYGGVVFCPLTRNLLGAWGGNWYNSAPKELVAMLSANFREEPDEEVVLVLKILADDVNQGYHNISNWVVKEVNGKEVRNLRGLVRDIEAETDDAYVVLKDEVGRQIVLDRKKVSERQQQILDTYRIPEDRSDDLVGM
jgi:C-terminal processing protease CtpA/Prc